MATCLYTLVAAVLCCRLVNSSTRFSAIQAIQTDLSQIKSDIAEMMSSIDSKWIDLAGRMNSIESRVGALEENTQLNDMKSQRRSDKRLAKERTAIESTASVQKRMHEADEACSHLGLDYYSCYFKELGAIDSNGLYVEAVGAQLLAAKCNRLTTEQVKEIAEDCNFVNDEEDVGDTVRAELMLRCVADKVDPEVCDIPVPTQVEKKEKILPVEVVE